MNKKGQSKSGIVAIVVILLLVAGAFIYLNQDTKTVNEHRQPADISDNEDGTGLDLRFYDADGNPIEIPDWFSTASIVSPLDTFSIVRHPPAPSCTAVSQCAGYQTNPNIQCWNGACVLGNVAAMDIGVNVQNPASSEITFTNVRPTTVTPSAVNSVFDKTPLSSLAPGESHSWQTNSPVDVTVWEGTQQTFSVSVAGVNQYTGATNTVVDSITLAIDEDPTGLFVVSVQSPVPQ